MRSVFETAERMAPVYPHAHRPERALGRMFDGPLVAVVDLVPGALRSGESS